MKRIAAEVEYAGTDYFGWQKQPNVPTIQSTIEKAIEEIAQKNIEIYASGRTDAGVHALGQIFHFDTNVDRPISAWIKGLNANLPNSIRIKWAQEVSAEFHARHSVIEREYQYLLMQRSMNSALINPLTGWTYYDLDHQAIKKALLRFEGQHDFSSFRSSECQAPSPIKTIKSFDCQFFSEFFLFTIKADGFLHHQIRNMMAVIILIGRGEKDIDFIDELFLENDRSKAPPTFMPNGLYLSNIKYDNHWDLPQEPNSLNIFKL